MLITSATSLIISSKNLMNTVISVVKSSYVASTKYSSKTDNKKVEISLLVWNWALRIEKEIEKERESTEKYWLNLFRDFYLVLCHIIEE